LTSKVPDLPSPASGLRFTHKSDDKNRLARQSCSVSRILSPDLWINLAPLAGEGSQALADLWVNLSASGRGEYGRRVLRRSTASRQHCPCHAWSKQQPVRRSARFVVDPRSQPVHLIKLTGQMIVSPLSRKITSWSSTQVAEKVGQDTRRNYRIQAETEAGSPDDDATRTTLVDGISF
jgi:hypothetical protein